MITTIQAFDAAKYKNAEHIQLHTNIRNIIEHAGSEECGVSDLIYDPYRHAISDEQDIVNKTYASTYTQEMQTADEERCRGLRLVMSKLVSVEFAAATSDVAKLWPTVKKSLLTPYKLGDMLKLPYQEKTSTITGFILDCRTSLTTTELTTLGISKDVDDLEVSNQQFSNMYQQRVGEKAEGSSLISSELRKVTDEAFLLFAMVLNANANDPNPQKKAQATACQEVIAKINVVIDEAKARVNQRLSGYTCVIEAISFDPAKELPVLLNDVQKFSIVGKRLQPKKIYLHMIAQLPDQLPMTEEAWLEDFLNTYGATHTLSKDSLTGFDVLTIEGWHLGEKELTLESIE